TGVIRHDGVLTSNSGTLTVNGSATSIDLLDPITTTTGDLALSGTADLLANIALTAGGAGNMTTDAIDGASTYNLSVDADTGTITIGSLVDIATFTVTDSGATEVTGAATATTVDLSSKSAG